MAPPLPPPGAAPTFQQALVVALLLRKRCAAAAGEAEACCARLGAEAQQLRGEAAAAASAPREQRPPLEQLVLNPPSAQQQPLHAPPAPEALQQQLESLSLWHQAAAALPPVLQPALVQAQRYLLLRELQQPPDAGGLSVAALLAHTPVRAFLKLAADILLAHAAAALPDAPAAAAAVAASLPGDSSQPAAPLPQLSAAHAHLLASCCACLVHLCNLPGQAAVRSDFEALQQFGSLVLQLAAQAAAPEPAGMGVLTPDQEPSGPTPALAPAAAAAPGAADSAAPDLQQRTSQVAAWVLAVLRQSPAAGTTLLSCAAPAARDCMAQLVQAVTGESLGSGGALASGSGSYSSLSPALAPSVEEAALLHTFEQLSHQLSAGLRLLPQWMAAVELSGDFMQARARKAVQLGCWTGSRGIHPGRLPALALPQDVAAAIMAARDASQLISVTHPGAARLMQRVAAQLIGALTQIAASDAAAGGS